MQHVGEPAYVGRVGRQQVERDPLRALGTDAGQPAELVDQVLDDAFVHLSPRREPRLSGRQCRAAWLPGTGRAGRMPGPPRPLPAAPPKPPASGPVGLDFGLCPALAVGGDDQVPEVDGSSRVAGVDGFPAIFTPTSSPVPLTVTVTGRRRRCPRPGLGELLLRAHQLLLHLLRLLEQGCSCRAAHRVPCLVTCFLAWSGAAPCRAERGADRRVAAFSY